MRAEPRRRTLCLFQGPPPEAWLTQAEVIAGDLRRELRRGPASSGVLHVRTLLLGTMPIVRVELHAEVTADFTDLMTRFLSLVDLAEK